VRAVGEGALPTTRTVQAIEALQRIATKS